MRTKSCRVGIRISEETRKRIEDSGKNISEYIREMLEGNVQQNCSTNVQQNEELDKLHQRIAELEEEIGDLRFANSLEGIPARNELEDMANQTCGIENFYESILNMVKAEEMDFNRDDFGISDIIIAKAIKDPEVSSQLKDFYDACFKTGADEFESVVKALKKGFEDAKKDMWNNRQ